MVFCNHKDSLSKPKKERKKAIKEALQDEFEENEDLTAFVNTNMERVKTNAIKRKSDLCENCVCRTGTTFARSLMMTTYTPKKRSEKNCPTR